MTSLWSLTLSSAALQRAGRTGLESNASRPKGWYLTCNWEIGQGVICFPDFMVDTQGLKSAPAWGGRLSWTGVIFCLLHLYAENPTLVVVHDLVKQQKHLLILGIFPVIIYPNAVLTTFIHSYIYLQSYNQWKQGMLLYNNVEVMFLINLFKPIILLTVTWQSQTLSSNRIRSDKKPK